MILCSKNSYAEIHGLVLSSVEGGHAEVHGEKQRKREYKAIAVSL